MCSAIPQHYSLTTKHSAEFALVAQQGPRNHGIGICSKKSIVKLIEKSSIIKQNSESYNNKYNIESNDIQHDEKLIQRLMMIYNKLMSYYQNTKRL